MDRQAEKRTFLGGETAPNLSLNRATGGEARLTDFALLSRKAGQSRFQQLAQGREQKPPRPWGAPAVLV